MTIKLSREIINHSLHEHVSSADYSFESEAVVTDSASLVKICEVLKSAPGVELDYLSSVTAVDYPDYFEVVYLFYSIKHNHSLILKVRCMDKQQPSIPSITPLYNGANYQEREIYDLFGISFTTHPKLRRIFLWEGYPGHPLRKDYGIGS